MKASEPPHKRRCTVCDRPAVVYGLASDSVSTEWCVKHGIAPESRVVLDLCREHANEAVGAR